MSAIDKFTVISSDGAAAIPRQVTDNLVQTMALLKSTTGLDLEQIVHRYAAGAPAAAGPTATPASGAPQLS
jgi:flotillin